MKDKQFTGIIENATNKKLGEDFGFIVGTFPPYTITSSFISESRLEGFEIWKKNIDGSYTTININTPKNVSKNIKDVIAFLLLDGVPLSIVFEIEEYQKTWKYINK